jgi:hypothetical protein
MATKNKAVAVEVDSIIATNYAVLIESGESTNLEALNFIVELNESMNGGITEEVAKESMKSVLQDVNVKPVVLPSHVSAVRTSSLIIKQFEGEISEIKAGKVLALAVRVNCDVKSANAKKHISKFATFAELDEGTRSKAESQARDGEAKTTQAIKESAQAITLESAVDGFTTWLKEQDLKTLKTTEAQKLDSLISKLIQVSKNSKAEVKVNA